MAVTDLTNTKWKWKDSGISITNDMVGVSTNRITGNVTCNKGSFTCNMIDINPTYVSYTNRVFIHTYDTSTSSTIYPALRYTSQNGWEYKATSEGVYESASDVVIEVTGGAQATNAQVIYCFETNATQITSGGSMYLGTSTISKMYLGNAEVSKVYLGQDLVYEKQASGYQVTFTALNNWSGANTGRVRIYDGQDTTGTLLLDQNPANKNAFPMTLAITSGKCFVSVYGPAIIAGEGPVVRSDDFNTQQIDYPADFLINGINKNGNVIIDVSEFND